MDGNTWLWIALIAFLIFCCVPMLRMGWGRRPSGPTDKGNPGSGPSEGEGSG